MKIYRHTPKDSETLIVLDENMKHRTIEGIFFRLFGYVCLFGLTVYGMIGGVTSKFAQDKLKSLDVWANDPANSALLSYTGLGVLVIALSSYVLWVFLLRKK